MLYFTTANRRYYEKNTKQLIASLRKYSGDKITVYSEDMTPVVDGNSTIIGLKKADEMSRFQQEFRAKFGERYKFFYYFQKMDIWILKIAAILQHLEETDEEYSVFIDSDSVVTHADFDRAVADFIKPFIESGKDIAAFRRCTTHLHTESGFAVFRKSPKLVEVYREMLEFVTSGRFYELASWTDCSVIDYFVDSGRLDCFDFCEYYSLKTTNPVYESNLRRSMLHLKGRRKGAYSLLKRLIGLYR